MNWSLNRQVRGVGLYSHDSLKYFLWVGIEEPVNIMATGGCDFLHSDKEKMGGKKQHHESVQLLDFITTQSTKQLRGVEQQDERPRACPESNHRQLSWATGWKIWHLITLSVYVHHGTKVSRRLGTHLDLFIATPNPCDVIIAAWTSALLKYQTWHVTA